MIMLPAELISDIENYQEEHRVRTRNEAIRELIQKGLTKVAEDSQEE
ncbi:MAG TPA: hypothetical protein VK061_04705 [Bacillota bacterium]|nr:hypothetical protein [Bacillota bacterium]